MRVRDLKVGQIVKVVFPRRHKGLYRVARCDEAFGFRGYVTLESVNNVSHWLTVAKDDDSVDVNLIEDVQDIQSEGGMNWHLELEP